VSDTDPATHDKLLPSEEELRRKAENDGVPDVQVVAPEVKVVPTKEETEGAQHPVSSLKSEVSEISESGSLMLEDPEDEDAEPDWL
jgi:hypothetical protein